MPQKEVLPPLQNLVVFESAARLLSFTRAAKEMGTTQPAVSQQVRSLEANLKCQLFSRIYRGVELTESGNKLLLATQKSLQELKLVCDDIRQRPQNNKITVATDFAFASYVLIPKLTEFRNQYQSIFPEMDIRLQTSQAPDVENSGDADIVIVCGANHYQAYDSHQLVIETVLPVCSKALLDGKSIDTLEELLTFPLLKLNENKSKSWLNWDDIAYKHGLTLNGIQPQFESDNYTLLVQAALAGQGVCLAWSPLLNDLIQKDILISFPQFSLTSNNGYHLIFTHTDEKTLLMETFVNWLKGEMKMASRA
ncbi:LysR substrate-binding domain-containing protein [Marinomonas sp. 15G1-11]|uniref:LysR substrate-binding domain-containing protein n=1 Tax=Marinomonas phaeophyticola TaxID=3004091 RepID=A0ABT4JPC7_9GAMM|nr:LysR substrate-binding domain-containing protein [Marinomonas sp. 15G1-11]MCZ2720075.1 LysR substrate-binding domain-containing protein [Marinomonas sp. 15G1-11]